MSGLTTQQRTAAVEYNRKRNYPDGVKEVIQKVVGLADEHVGGPLGPRTADLVHKWQAQLMEEDKPDTQRMPVADGRMGASSLGRMAGELLQQGATREAALLLRSLRKVLEDGNGRWRRAASQHPNQARSRSSALVKDQRPFAVVLACVDSRVPPELVFDQGVGDLFTVRTAGQVLDRAVYGSIEYALKKLLTPLVVVLGHTNCGAVGAASGDGVSEKGNLDCLAWLADRIEAGISVEENAERVRDQLRDYVCLKKWLAAPDDQVIAGVYDLESRAVNFR